MNTIPDEVIADIEQRSDHQLLQLLREGARSWPHDPEVLASLGQVLTRLGHYHEGLRVDQRLLQLCPDDPVVHYNLACSLSLLGRTEEALRSLDGAVERGYTDFAFLETDPDLSSVRGDPRFAALMKRWAGRT